MISHESLAGNNLLSLRVGMDFIHGLITLIYRIRKQS